MGVYTLQQHIHVRDSVDDKVREVRVVGLDKDKNSIKIHYKGWNGKHDEWLLEDSDRIISDTNMSENSDDEFEDENPVVSQQTKEAIGKLLNRVGENCKPIVAAFECNKSIEQNSEILNDSFKVAQLRDVAQVLNLEIQNKAGKNLLKKVLSRNIAMCIKSLMPSKCLQCKDTYAVNLDDTPLFKCHLCTRGSHNCTGLTEFKAALPSSLLEGFVWLCVDCVQKGDADSSSLDEKVVGEKLTNAKNESNCNHTQDSAANPSAVASSSSSANNSHNNANPDADDEEEGESWIEVRGRKARNKKTPQRRVNNTNSVQNSSNTNVSQNHRNTDLPHGSSPQNARSTAAQNANQAQRGNCYKYKRGTCPHGMSGNKLVDGNKCKYEHPRLCKYFNTSSKGCMNGASCTFFHPILCKFSVKQRLCTNINCKFAHLKGTAREAPKEPFRQQPEYEVRKNSNFANVSTNDFLQLKQMVERLNSRLEDRTKYTQMPYYPQVPTYNTYQGPKVQNLGYPMSMPPMYPLVTNQHQQMRQASVFQNNMPPSSY